MLSSIGQHTLSEGIPINSPLHSWVRQSSMVTKLNGIIYDAVLGHNMNEFHSCTFIHVYS